MELFEKEQATAPEISKMTASAFNQLFHATRIVSSTTKHFLQVDEWKAKRETLAIQLADLPVLVEAHKNRRIETYPQDARINLVDVVPTVRLANACEATANGLYSLAEVAANFANRASKGVIPSSFNTLRKKCEDDATLDLALALGDLQWFRKVRELRTEWVHHSSVFIAGGHGEEPILCVRSYRRPSDRTEFQSPNFTCSVGDLVGWVRSALSTLEAFAGYLLMKYVVPVYPSNDDFDIAVTDKNGLPIFKEDYRLTTERITWKEYLKRGGIPTNG